MSPRFSRPQQDPAPPSFGAARELRDAVVAAARDTARFRYCSAVSDPFGAADPLGGWEDTGLVDFRRPAAWFRRVWQASEEGVGLLDATGLVVLRPDGAARMSPGAPHLVNATANPVGMLRLLDPAFTSAAPAGAGRWRIAIDLADAQELLGASAFGPGVVRLGASLPATAQIVAGRLEIVAIQVGVWGEPHAWASVRFSDWGVEIPPLLDEMRVATADAEALAEHLGA